jgi:hypothetical protein
MRGENVSHALEDLKLGESKTVEWRVSQAHIDHGQRADCWGCPIALSLQEMFPGLVPEVDSNLTLCVVDEYGENEPVFKAVMPLSGAFFIEAFDSREAVVPIILAATFERVG